MAKKKKERRIDAITAAGAAGALGGAASIRDPRKYMGKHMGTGMDSIEALLAKAKPGDIILAGRKTDFARLGPDEISDWANRLFFRGMKTGTQSYTPHGMIVYGGKKARTSKLIKRHGVITTEKSKHVLPTQIANQVENLEKIKGGEIAGKYDRVVIMRPKKPLTPSQLDSLKDISTREIKAKRPYASGQAGLQGALGTVLPKRARECFIKGKGGSSFCTGFPGEAMQRAGAPIVKGKGSAALAKDIIASKKVKSIGWAGAPVSKLEKFKAVHAPRAIRALAYGAGAAAAAYGVAKAVGKFSKKNPPKAKVRPKTRPQMPVTPASVSLHTMGANPNLKKISKPVQEWRKILG